MSTTCAPMAACASSSGHAASGASTNTSAAPTARLSASSARRQHLVRGCIQPSASGTWAWKRWAALLLDVQCSCTVMLLHASVLEILCGMQPVVCCGVRARNDVHVPSMHSLRPGSTAAAMHHPLSIGPSAHHWDVEWFGISMGSHLRYCAGNIAAGDQAPAVCQLDVDAAARHWPPGATGLLSICGSPTHQQSPCSG